MRLWTVVADGPSDDFGFSEPYTASCEIKRFLESNPSATEEDVIRIARGYHCTVLWTLKPCTVVDDMSDNDVYQIVFVNDGLYIGSDRLHCGDVVEVFLPWRYRFERVTIDLYASAEPQDLGAWYISVPGFEHISPIGLFAHWWFDD